MGWLALPQSLSALAEGSLTGSGAELFCLSAQPLPGAPENALWHLSYDGSGVLPLVVDSPHMDLGLPRYTFRGEVLPLTLGQPGPGYAFEDISATGGVLGEGTLTVGTDPALTQVSVTVRLTDLRPGAQVTDSGDCGKLTWWLFDDGLLYIFGTGAMPNYQSGEDTPWAALRDKITALTLSDGVTTVGSCAFQGCTELTDVTLPNNLTALGESAFSQCTALEEITLPNTLTAIPNFAFYRCAALNRVTVPTGLLRVGASAFQDCAALSSISLPGTVTFLGASAFQGCTSLAAFTVPAGVTAVGNSVFRRCTGLQSVTFPQGVTAIGQYAFEDCALLRQAALPQSLTALGNYAFNRCAKLEQVDIPAALTALGDSAFAGCAALRAFTVAEENPRYAARDGVLFNKDHTLLIQYPAGLDSASYAVPHGVTELGAGAFTGASGLETLTLPQSLTTLGSSVFQDCAALTALALPQGVTAVSSAAFWRCTSLTWVALPGSVTSVGANAFLGCTALGDVFYAGADRTALTLSPTGNDPLTGAWWHYRYSGGAIVPLVKGAVTGGELELPCAMVFAGETLSVTVLPQAGYRFQTLTVENGVPDRTSFTVDLGDFAQITVGALFEELRPQAAVTASGELPNGLSWWLYDTGELYLTGAAVPDFAREDRAPWYPQRAAIKLVTLDSGVTSIGGYAFVDCPALTDVFCPGSRQDVSVVSTSTALTEAYWHCYYRGGDIVTLQAAPADSLGQAIPRCAYAYKGELVTLDVRPAPGYTYRADADHGTGRVNTVLIDPAGDFDAVTLSAQFHPARQGVSMAQSGTCGDTLSWCLYEDGELFISGTGPMKRYTLESQVPWTQWREDITSCYVDYGAESVGVNALAGCEALTRVLLPGTVSQIGGSAFARCAALTQLVMGPVAEVGTDAFSGCDALERLWVLGQPTGWTGTNLGSGNDPLRAAPRGVALGDLDGVILLMDRLPAVGQPGTGQALSNRFEGPRGRIWTVGYDEDGVLLDDFSLLPLTREVQDVTVTPIPNSAHLRLFALEENFKPLMPSGFLF